MPDYPDHSNMRLGKRTARLDHRVRALAAVTNALPPPPPSCDWSTKLAPPLGVMLNDKLGDCTCAAMGHAIQTWTSQASTQKTVSDQVVELAYEQACGYIPGRYDTDIGGVEVDVLNWWLKHPLDGHELAAFASVQPASTQDIRDAIYLFGGCYIGLALPRSAQTQDVWTVPPGGAVDAGAPGSWGGHAVFVVGYDERGLTCITWGATKRMTWTFWNAYCVTPETRILTTDLRWVRADTLRAGDRVMGFDENGPRRRWRDSFVESAPLIERPCYELEFEDGTIVRSSSEHPWLCRGSESGWGWIATERMRADKGCASHVVKPVDVWETDQTREGGYLAAAFDGEGCLHQGNLSGKRYSVGAASATYSVGAASTRIEFCQRDNEMLYEVERCLALKGFASRATKPRPDTVRHVYICRRRELLRFLGSMRPPRLLKRFDPNVMGGLSGDASRIVRLIRKTDIGQQTVVALKTTTRTYIAEGLAAHNSDEAYGLLSHDWLSDGAAPPGLDWDALVADLNSLR